MRWRPLTKEESDLMYVLFLISLGLLFWPLGLIGLAYVIYEIRKRIKQEEAIKEKMRRRYEKR